MAAAVESQDKDGFGIDEYLPQPRWLSRLDGECACVRTMEPNGRNDMSYVVVAGDADACIHIPRYWNTRYAASIDDVPIPVYADQNGEVLIAPSGRVGLLNLRFTSPAYVTIASVLSAAAALLLLVRVTQRRR